VSDGTRAKTPWAPVFLDIAGVGHELQVSARQVRRLLSAGKLPAADLNVTGDTRAAGGGETGCWRGWNRMGQSSGVGRPAGRGRARSGAKTILPIAIIALDKTGGAAYDTHDEQDLKATM
jgi:hypothetical protein